jgi:WD40 repeat protein
MNSIKIIANVLLFFIAVPLFGCSLCSFYGFDQPVCQLDKELQYMITKELLEQTPEILYPLTVAQPICTLSAHDDFVRSVHFVNNTLISNGEDKLCVWNIDQAKSSDTTKPVKTYPIASGNFSAIAVSPNKKILATCSCTTANIIKLWDLQSVIACQEPILLETLTGHTGSIAHIDFSPDSNHLLSASRDKTIKLWKLSTNKPILEVRLSGRCQLIHHVGVSRDLTTIIAVCGDNRLYLWQSDNNFSQPRVIPFPSFDTDQESSFNIRFAYFIDNDTRILITGIQSNRYIYDIETRQLISQETDHTQGSCHVCFNEQNHSFINSSEDCTATLCDNRHNKTRIIFSKHEKAILESDANTDYTLLATGSSDKTIKLWQIPDFSNLTLKQTLFLRFMRDITCVGNGKVLLLDFPKKKNDTVKKEMMLLQSDLQEAFGSFTYVQQRLLTNKFRELKVFLTLDLKKQIKKEQATSTTLRARSF